jgi:hypothetical protein
MMALTVCQLEVSFFTSRGFSSIVTTGLAVRGLMLSFGMLGCED